jgi:hypothetical protein
MISLVWYLGNLEGKFSFASGFGKVLLEIYYTIGNEVKLRIN